ncbi:MAG: GAF domain-containing protein, partial [Archangium sp.]
MADDIVALTRAELRREAWDLLELATREEAVAELLRRGLDWLTRVVRFDLATLFLLREGTLVAVAARGPLASEQVRRHELALADFPTLRQALETRRARAFTQEDHAHGDGDPFDGVLDLPPGHSCMVVPLCAGERCYGLLTLDRTQCETYPQAVVDLVEVYGQLLATSLQEAEQKSTFERLQ